MGVWQNLFKKAISPVVDETINKYKQEEELKKVKIQQQSSLSPLQVSGEFFTPWPVGAGLVGESGKKAFQRGVNFQTLRDFAYFYPVLRACVNSRKRQISQLNWDITSIEVQTTPAKKKLHKDDAKAVKEFFRHPTGEPHVNFRHFLDKIMEDMLVIDALSIYRRRNRGGGIHSYIPIDGSTIQLILNEDGTTPYPPEPAYVQKIGGRETCVLNTDELIYRIMNPRTSTPYGLSAVESLLVIVTTALKLQQYNLAYLSEGNVPEGFITLPKDVASNPDQLKSWQEAWDGLMSGDPRYQRKVKFLPDGMHWEPVKKPGDIEYEKFDQWLMLNTCAMMEVPPTAIGMNPNRGKGTAETDWEIGKERGQYPLAHTLKELFDEIIQVDLKQTHLEFVWTNINPTNKLDEAQIFKSLVDTGAVSVDEWRIGEGLDPIGLDQYIMTPVGAVRVKDFIKFSDEGNPIVQPNAKPGGSVGSAGDGGSAGGGGQPNKATPAEKAPNQNLSKPNTAKKIEQINALETIEEIKRWKKCAVNDFKIGKKFRDFKSAIIDERTQKLIRDGLEKVEAREDIEELFGPLMSYDSSVINAVLDLYHEMETIEKTYGQADSQINPAGN